MDRKILAAITAAVNAYIECESHQRERRLGQRLSPWKMAARRETVSKKFLVARADPARIRLRRFSIF